MQRTACGQVLLVITIALLAANLVTMLVVNTAAPANAQAGRTCVGVTLSASDAPIVFRVWSDGTVEFSSTFSSHPVEWRKW